jgi:pilus assembly protein CpaD
MLNNLKKTAVTLLGPVLMLGSAGLLTACSDTLDGDSYPSTAYYENYPIDVRQAPVKMGVASRTGSLKPDQVNAVVNFARDANQNAESKISVRYPSGSVQGRHAAGEIAALMANQGVPRSMISVASYSGGASAPVQMSFQRKVAVTRECGDWSENLAFSYYNTLYPNNGCAMQNNIAALVANPEDLEHPRAEGPSVATARTAALQVYFTSPTAISSVSESETKMKTEKAVVIDQ